MKRSLRVTQQSRRLGIRTQVTISEPTLLTTACFLRSLRRRAFKGSRILSAYPALREAPPSPVPRARGEGLGALANLGSTANPGPGARTRLSPRGSRQRSPPASSLPASAPISQERRHLVTFLHSARAPAQPLWRPRPLWDGARERGTPHQRSPKTPRPHGAGWLTPGRVRTLERQAAPGKKRGSLRRFEPREDLAGCPPGSESAGSPALPPRPPPPSLTRTGTPSLGA